LLTYPKQTLLIPNTSGSAAERLDAMVFAGSMAVGTSIGGVHTYLRRYI
jgi:hypothetical protein